MTGKDILLTEMLCAAIYNREFDISKYKTETINWEEIYKEARAHQVHTVIYPIIKEIDPKIGPDEKLMSLWSISAISCGIQMISGEVWLGQVIEAFDAVGIKTIVLKGMAINKCYPHPELRTMGDADILVQEDNIEKATKVLESMGYISGKDKKTKHIEFYKKNAISIELHRLLIDFNFMHLNQSFHDEIWEKTILVNLGLVKINILSWEMQILHICIHMGAHINNGGIGLRQLCDLVTVVEAKRNEINWNIVQDRVIKYGIGNLIYSLFLVCNRLFNMEIPLQIVNEDVNNNEKLDKFIDDIYAGGNLGNRDIYRTSANILMANSNKYDELKYKNKFFRAIQILFPNRTIMVKRKRYIYVNKSPLLLPFGWIHRIIYGMKRKDFSFQDKKALFNDNNLNLMASNRNNLLEWLGLR